MMCTYDVGIHGTPKRCGKIKETTKFDSLFFKVNPKEANVMDPQQRINHEVVYEALVDAGIRKKDHYTNTWPVILNSKFNNNGLGLK